VPAPGVELGDAYAKLPATVADPPLSVAVFRAEPYVMAVATGVAVTVGVALLTVTFTEK